MAMIETTSLPVRAQATRAVSFAAFRRYWAQFFSTAFNPYRPELHYMRGPGPAWRAKHGMDAPFRLKPRDL